jgi:hypothetical protein
LPPLRIFISKSPSDGGALLWVCSILCRPKTPPPPLLLLLLLLMLGLRLLFALRFTLLSPLLPVPVPVPMPMPLVFPRGWLEATKGLTCANTVAEVLVMEVAVALLVWGIVGPVAVAAAVAPVAVLRPLEG